MRDPSTLILLSLVGGPQHGYAIQQEIERRASVRLGPGTLYGAIARLEDAGLILAVESTERRQPYRLTPAGRKELTKRLDDMRLITSWAHAVRAS
jgi:DNA-binding PadR family transcriptional regulator